MSTDEVHCFRHVRHFVQTGRGEEPASQMLNWLTDLAEQLGDFCRKHSWDRRHEPKGREQGSWQLALALFVGGVDGFCID